LVTSLIPTVLVSAKVPEGQVKPEAVNVPVSPLLVWPVAVSTMVICCGADDSGVRLDAKVPVAMAAAASSIAVSAIGNPLLGISTPSRSLLCQSSWAGGDRSRPLPGCQDAEVLGLSRRR
jgi:hypothetical protein